MEIQSVGGMANAYGGSGPGANLKLDDFLKLFVAQLNYQDPLEPVNNSEFLAQLAQFSSLELNRQSNENSLSLLAFSSSDQALSLLGRIAEVSGAGSEQIVGEVVGITFSAQGPLLSVKSENDIVLTDISLGRIKVVK